MQKTILELNAEEVRQYFLKSSRFCTIELPKYFDFQKLLDNLEKIINKQTVFDITPKGDSKQPNDCENVNYHFFTNKDGNLAWRKFQIINPAIYICLVNQITKEENWETIQNRFREFQSNSKIVCCSIPLHHENTDTELNKDNSVCIFNWWKDIEQKSIELALEFNCVLITDITDCYDSIYTHSIGWALHEKKEAREHRNKKPPKLIGCIIDNIIQSMSYRQTNGIPQGSVLMDFIAEMVLGYADYKLSKELKVYKDDYKILRYRDDYRIFANSQETVVKIAKLLSEVLSDLNLKLNKQKTFVSNDIIKDVIKPDKLYWLESKHGEKTLQKHLLLIHALAERHPNSGSLIIALSKFIDRISPLKILKEDSSKVLISILIDIAYNNPRVYSYIIVCIGKILSIESDSDTIDNIYKLIEKKFTNKSNIGHWEVWYQRLTIKENRTKGSTSNEKLCKIAAGNNEMLWNISWLKPQYQEVFKNTSIFDEEIYDNLEEVPKKDEVKYYSTMYT